MAATEPARSPRAQALYVTRRAKMDQIFLGKRFVIRQTVALSGEDRFRTPFGNVGRRGYILEEEGNPDNRFYVGARVLEQVARDYGAVTVPEKRRRRRRRSVPAAPEPDYAPEELLGD